jgi:hypothetical protein
VLELIETMDPKKARELSEKLTPSEALKQRAEAAGGNNQKLSAEMQKRIQELMEKQKQQQPAPMPGPVAPAPPSDAAPQDAPPADAPAAPAGSQ